MPGLRDVCTPRSPPMSPKEQLGVMHSQEEKMREVQREPSERDLEAGLNEFRNKCISCWLDVFESPFSDRLLILTSPIQRYMYYITTGIPGSVLAPQPSQLMMNVMRLLPPETEDSNKHLQILRTNMEEEVKRDYYFSLKKSIGIKQ